MRGAFSYFTRAVLFVAAVAAAGCRAASVPPAENAGADSLPAARFVHAASGIAFVLIPAGSFTMGDAHSAAPARGETRHARTISRPFFLSVTEVTTGQFRRFVEATGYLTDAERGVREGGHGRPEGTIDRGAFAATERGDRDWSDEASWRRPFPLLPAQPWDDEHPAVHVSWNDAAAFCRHFGMRLPAEAEWEYAHRAGSSRRYFWGDDAGGGAGFGNAADAAARARFPSRNDTFAFDDGEAVLGRAGAYRPNAWGVRDTFGSLEEWTQDVYTRDPSQGTDGSPATEATGAADAPRVVRGCSWIDGPDLCRSSARFGMLPSSRRDFIGFRVAMDLSAARAVAGAAP